MRNLRKKGKFSWSVFACCESGDLARSCFLGYLLMAQKAADGLARLGAASEPILNALGVEFYGCRLLQRIVRPHNFNEAAVARAGLLNHDDTIGWLFLLANAGQPDHQHSFIPPKMALTSIADR